MTGSSVGEILTGLWRFEALHPDWTEDEGGDEDGWEQSVAWWAIATPRGLVLVDPLVSDFVELDRIVGQCGGCAGVVRTCHWHQRSVAEASDRYRAGVWAHPPPDGTPRHPLDHAVSDRESFLEGFVAVDVERADEIALWLPGHGTLLFGDAMIRRQGGELRVCPDSWTQPKGGPARLRAVLASLADLPVEHVLVAHGPLVLGVGLASLHAALR